MRKLKKSILVLLIFTVIFVAAGCSDDKDKEESGAGSGSANNHALPELSGEPGEWEFYNTRAEFIVISMANGDFNSVVAMFDATMSRLQSASVTGDIWTAIIAQAGEFTEIHGIENLEHEEDNIKYHICFITSRHENSGVTLQLVFDESGLVAGFFIADYPVLDDAGG